MITKIVRRRRTGLGDLVEVVARPAARAIDRMMGTSLEDCGGCGRRKQRLNHLAPNVNPMSLLSRSTKET